MKLEVSSIQFIERMTFVGGICLAASSIFALILGFSLSGIAGLVLSTSAIVQSKRRLNKLKNETPKAGNPPLSN